MPENLQALAQQMRKSYIDGGGQWWTSAPDCPRHLSEPELYLSFNLWTCTCLWPGSGLPFCALPMKMNLNDRCVDHCILNMRIIAYSIEQALKYIGVHPVAESLEERVPSTEIRWQVPPWAASPDNP